MKFVFATVALLVTVVLAGCLEQLEDTKMVIVRNATVTITADGYFRMLIHDKRLRDGGGPWIVDFPFVGNDAAYLWFNDCFWYFTTRDYRQFELHRYSVDKNGEGCDDLITSSAGNALFPWKGQLWLVKQPQYGRVMMEGLDKKLLVSR